MLKRIILFAFILSTLVLVALAPMNNTPTVNLQATVIAPPPVVATVMAPLVPSDGPAPVAGMALSTMIIIGLMVVLGLAVIVGGMALVNRRA